MGSLNDQGIAAGYAPKFPRPRQMFPEMGFPNQAIFRGNRHPNPTAAFPKEKFIPTELLEVH
jgi:hypothetical protein